ncbi:hypothetical protein NEOLEDRAFT_1161767 [Neolentinus lepideus HHB14362 ss-1]|uniref:PBP domain-containing protein n=1 Tax=Neolentinus lepideus HHB14362 ss-1 TaxID=1314782 RepID=A0A165TUR2_9AGAM|nr:hypothetical protein NEOLEDRAFT_1161767 [Neolentinus lepideus HHB14362 ss-1]
MSQYYTGEVHRGDDHVYSEHRHQIPNVKGRDSAGSSNGAVHVPDGLFASIGTLPAPSDLAPQAVYDGGFTGAQEIYVRIANGGAGQSGLIGAWANAFIQYSVKKGVQPFLVAWYLADTTESLGLLEAGSVDIAVTYNEAAELQKMKNQTAVRREYGFRDHFYLVGPLPRVNPAGLKDKEDDILTMFNKIVATGNAHSVAPPLNGVPTRFLSRYDKSATNIKESELFVAIGQTPWALAYSKWYHQYPRFPIQALKAAAVLEEYTLTDRGTYLSSEDSTIKSVYVYKAGSDDPSDRLLLPGHVLLGSKVKYLEICTSFMDWVIDKDGGQKVVREFKHKGQVVYSTAPVKPSTRA